MLSPNELRIGNWIHEIIEGPRQVRSITTQKVKDGNYQLVNSLLPEHVRPIALTAEILLASGFIESKRHKNLFIKGKWRVKLRPKGDNWLFNAGDKFNNNINSVHKFQNIWFDYTGEELEINIL